jgi:starvation-inducible outer membrane lipoprotein
MEGKQMKYAMILLLMLSGCATVKEQCTRENPCMLSDKDL